MHFLEKVSLNVPFKEMVVGSIPTGRTNTNIWKSDFQIFVFVRPSKQTTLLACRNRKAFLSF